MGYQIEHIGVTVTDLDEAVKWYNTNFGFEETRRFDKPELGLKAATLKLGDSYLELLQLGEQALGNYLYMKTCPESLEFMLSQIGVNHIALNVDNIQTAYDRLKENNVEFVTDLIDSRYFFCIDPDETLLEIKQKK